MIRSVKVEKDLYFSGPKRSFLNNINPSLRKDIIGWLAKNDTFLSKIWADLFTYSTKSSVRFFKSHLFDKQNLEA